MSWWALFRLRRYVSGSMWVIPVLGGVAGNLIGIAVADSGVFSNFSSAWHYSTGTADAVLAAVVGASVALIGFVLTVSILIAQMAIGTFSARYMRAFYQDGLLKATLAILVGTLTFSYTELRRVGANSVPDLGVTLGGFFLAVGIVIFLVFLSRSLHRLRPVAVAALVARAGEKAFKDVVLRLAASPDAPDLVHRPERPVEEPTLVVPSRRAGAIQAIDARGLGQFARAHDCVVVVPRVIGDFVPVGAVLVEVYGDGATAAEEQQLRSMIALGVERTIEQDPAFAIRVMVDIASKALSPGINDPTTAVQVLDHLGGVLRLIGATPLEHRREPGGRSGEAKVVISTRSWEDVLALAVTEIRQFGGSSIQVVRRLRALLEELRESVLPEHAAAVEDEIARVDATLAEFWSDSVDLDRARIPDREGIGGSGTTRPTR